ncbi:formate dehydrogenase accessory sulfurtransferase FdhD [Amphritea sp. 1_MG-2023]|uniref:formate dehydrogenase accessory sulfurtransferase FdhD n=1 Tax=Amphritea sp. 1_MG-2023 TaxID=3062670 RepID=UPI0026E43090|nr:formate dehydrogenase accessory sulfurtransferase FdhD [Amphritea sp. 1_MG-2023]MDO6561951.1 formate dehydrogenase accessory sulfurtransferase FdhD [Amphritea sp. 1_MG-2023]
MALKQPKTETSEDSLALSLEDCYTQAAVNRWQADQTLTALDQIADEVPVAMVYNGISHAVMMASPCDLDDFALGFSLSEGIIKTADELYGLELVRAEADNLAAGIEIQLSITTQRSMQLKQRRRNLTGRTGCGLCGTESLQQAIRPVKQVPCLPPASPAAVEHALQQLQANQPLQTITGACHGAAWCDLQGNIQLLREDVGRHNALDKLVGALQRAATDLSQGFILVSSRASYEMVHKAASCGISSLVAVSAPTGLALQLAQQAGLNLIGFARPGRHVIYHQSITTGTTQSFDDSEEL